MTRAELTEIIRNGENSSVEFKRDDVHADSLAREMSALLNFEGGVILLGVEDDGGVSGLRNRADAERRIMEIARGRVQPGFIPSWSVVVLDGGAGVGVVRIGADEPGKPYKAKRGSHWATFVRVGGTSREATRDEEGRLHQAGRLMRYEMKPVLDVGLEGLDRHRREGVLRVSRNELVKDVLRDCGYVEHLGMGVRKRIIAAMREQNGTEPDLIEEERRFVVRLWKEQAPAQE